MIGWMPPQMMNVFGSICRSRLITLPGQVGVAGHRREADQVAAGQAVGDLVDLGVAQLALAAVGAEDRVAEAAVLVGGDVVRLGVGVEPRDVGRDLAEPARGDSVLEADQLHAQQPPPWSQSRGRRASGPAEPTDQ